MRLLVVEPERDVMEEDGKGESVECATDETDGGERVFGDLVDDLLEEFEGKRIHCGSVVVVGNERVCGASCQQ